jgi:hypothetical protein
LVSPGRPFARHAAAAGKRQQQTCADDIKPHATLHIRKNASSFFNEASTPVAGDFVKDKKSLPQCAPYLEPLAAFGSHHYVGARLFEADDLIGKPVLFEVMRLRRLRSCV